METEAYREKIGALRRESGSLLRYDAAVYLGVLPVSGPEIDGTLEFRSRGIVFCNAASRHFIYIPAGEIADAVVMTPAAAGLPATAAPEEGVLMIEQMTENGVAKHVFRVENPLMLADGVKKIRDDSRRAAPPGEDVFARIKKLAELRDAGVLTEAEFSAKKTELLKDI